MDGLTHTKQLLNLLCIVYVYGYSLGTLALYKLFLSFGVSIKAKILYYNVI